MTSPSWSPDYTASECWRSESIYEGPSKSRDGRRFVICASLDAGAEKHFSGIHFLVCCEDTDDFKSLKVTDEDKWAGRKRTEELLQCKNSSLPYCPLVYEIVDKTDDNYHCADLILRQSMRTDVPIRTLYEYIKPCTSSSKSLVLYLYSSRTFRRQLRSDNKIGIMCAMPAAIGMRAHGVRILPPSTTRPLFQNPPPEILSLIFDCAVEDKMYTRWRTDLVAFAKVCRQWIPALDHLFKDFGEFSGGSYPPDMTAVAKALQLNPSLGRAIRTFCPRHFSDDEEEDKEEQTEESCFALSEALVQILRTAIFARAVEAHCVHKTLVDRLAEALCVSRDVREFMNFGFIPATAADKYKRSLTLVDIFRCMTNWPHLSQLKLYGFSGSNDDPLLDNTSCQCMLQILFLCSGAITGTQLKTLTTSSLSTLREVHLEQISGLTNEGLRAWLVEAGPSLTTFVLGNSTVTRRASEEEYALDAMVATMVNLEGLRLDGDVATELVVLRKERRTTNNYRSDYVTLKNITGLNEHGLVNALRYTGWGRVETHDLFSGNLPLEEEGKKIADERKFAFWCYH